MNVIIWGTGVRGMKVLEFCSNKKWKINGFIDNDKEKWDSYIQGVKVYSPEAYNFGIENVIMIATGADGVLEQALGLSENVLSWECVHAMVYGSENPNYPGRQLKTENIKNCRLFANREAMLEMFKNCTTMVEIGVADGDFSELILSICQPEKFILIDAWDDKRFEPGYNKVLKRFEKEISLGQIEIHRGYSVNELDKLNSNSVDWFYIDTVHDYDTTWQELVLCHEKLAADGYICGHDYAKYNVYSRCDYGVYDAVNKFASEYGYEFIYLTLEVHGLQSFCLKKLN